MEDFLLQTIIDNITNGKIKPWDSQYKKPHARNYISKKSYNIPRIENLYDNPWWLTERQVKNLGGRIKKGETGYIIHDRNRFFEVYNVAQCTNIAYVKPKQPRQLSRCNKLVAKYLSSLVGPKVLSCLNFCAYVYDDDIIYLPLISEFNSLKDYHFGKFHEIIHSAEFKVVKGFNSTVNIIGKKSKKLVTIYSRSEIIADLGALILAKKSRILSSQMLQREYSYLNMYINKYLWSEGLGKSKKHKVALLQQTWKDAEKIVAYILTCS